MNQYVVFILLVVASILLIVIGFEGALGKVLSVFLAPSILEVSGNNVTTG